MVSMEFLASVSATLIYGTSVKGSLYSYYYSTSFTYNTYPPTGIVAILKNAGIQVAKLKGRILNPSWNGTCYSVCLMFYDLSFDCYTFTCICIYTCSSNTLYVLVTRITGLNYTKEKQFLLTITYELSVICYEIVSGIYWIAVSFAWVLCGVNNVFKVKQYTGINKITLCNLNGEIELVAIGLCPNGVVFYANIYTNGSLSNPDQGAYIVAFTNTLPPNLTFITGHVSPTTTPQSIVFRIPINYKFPVSNNKYYVPVKFGVTFF